MIRSFDTLAARTIFVSLIGITLMHVLSLWTYEKALDRELSSAHTRQLAERLVTIRRSLTAVPEEERDDAAHRLSGGPLNVHWSRNEKAIPGGAGAEQWGDLTGRLRLLEPELGPEGIVVGAADPKQHDPHVALVSLRLPDSTWVNVSLLNYTAPDTGGHGTLLSTSVMALGVIALSVVIARWLTRPITRMAAGVRALHPGDAPARLAEAGPREVRDLAIAFNDMQDRIARLIDERTRALAAVSHDLRTPLTRLKLRIEDLANPELGQAITADLAELEQMIDATLSYLKGESDDEAPRALDLAALLRSIADDASDLGQDVTLTGPRSQVCRGRHLGLKRAFSNLVQNAVKYGHRARLSTEATDASIVVHIDDDGPGIPTDMQKYVLEPFVRLETSRSRETGGVGLGLTIAKSRIAADGGQLDLSNRPDGGLRVTVSLPKAA